MEKLLNRAVLCGMISGVCALTAMIGLATLCAAGLKVTACYGHNPPAFLFPWLGVSLLVVVGGMVALTVREGWR